MSKRERLRLEAFGQVKRKQISVGKAGQLCGISARQARRVWKRYKELGDVGLVHGLRGQAGNRGKGSSLRAETLAAYRERYGGFGAQLASEYLAQEGIMVPTKTLWRWLRQEGLLPPKRRHQRHRQRRERRLCYGELVQMDGSTHDWFEGRGPVCVVFVMIDDAIGKVFCRFYATEDTASAFDLFRQYARGHGLPRSLYVDKDSIYTVNNRVPTAREALSGTGPVTQFGRAMKQLGVEIILANSPQAKGRVERMNGTLQDRLVKGLRVENISTIPEANVYLEKTFLPGLNERFGVKSRTPANVHRRVVAAMKLEEVLCVVEERTVGRDWCVTYERRVLQLDARHQNLGLACQKVKVLALADGSLQLRYQNRVLKWQEIGPAAKSVRAFKQHTLTPQCGGMAAAGATAAPASAAPQPARPLPPPHRSVLMRR